MAVYDDSGAVCFTILLREDLASVKIRVILAYFEVSREPDNNADQRKLDETFFMSFFRDNQNQNSILFFLSSIHFIIRFIFRFVVGHNFLCIYFSTLVVKTSPLYYFLYKITNNNFKAHRS